MPDDEIEVPPLSVQLQIAEAALELQQVASREAALARAAAKSPNDLLEADIDALVAMAMKMDEQMAIAERHADFLHRTFAQFGPWPTRRSRRFRLPQGASRLSVRLQRQGGAGDGLASRGLHDDRFVDSWRARHLLPHRGGRLRGCPGRDGRPRRLLLAQ